MWLSHFSRTFVSLLLVEISAPQQMSAQRPWSTVSTVQTHTVHCCQKAGGLECTTSLTRESKWMEGRKQKDQTADPWDSGVPVQGSWVSEGGRGGVLCIL